MAPTRSSTSNDRIRELIEALGMSQIEFCKKTGIKPSALSNYLNGTRVPRQDAIMRIADAFNISAAWLMGYDVPKKSEQTIIGIQIDEDNKTDKLEIWDTANRLRLYADLIAAAGPFADEQIKRFIEALEAFNVPKGHKNDTT